MFNSFIFLFIFFEEWLIFFNNNKIILFSFFSELSCFVPCAHKDNSSNNNINNSNPKYFEPKQHIVYELLIRKYVFFKEITFDKKKTK